MIKVCIFCHCDFDAKRINSRFCSNECRCKQYNKDNPYKIREIERNRKNKNERSAAVKEYDRTHKKEKTEYNKQYWKEHPNLNKNREE